MGSAASTRRAFKLLMAITISYLALSHAPAQAQSQQNSSVNNIVTSDGLQRSARIDSYQEAALGGAGRGETIYFYKCWVCHNKYTQNGGPHLSNLYQRSSLLSGDPVSDESVTNESDESFWEYVRTAHDGILVMFEAKNTNDLGLTEINQTATYLGDRIGRLGVIVTRRSPPETVQRKIFSVWNDSDPNRKVILTLTDAQLSELLDLRCRDNSPTKWIQKHYRAFRTTVQ